MNVHILPLIVFIAGFFILGIFLFALSKRSTPLNRVFTCFALAGLIYTFGYGFELLSYSMQQMLFWSKVQYIGISIAPAIMVLIAVFYTGKQKHLSVALLFLLFLVPALTLGARLSNEFHHLFYARTVVETTSLGRLLHIYPGPLYYIHVVYSLITELFSMFLLFRFKKQTLFFYKRQSYIILAATSMQLFGLAFYLTGFGPEYVDLNPFLVFAGALLYAIGIFRFNLFDLAPLARDLVFENMSEAVLVVDSELHLADFNKQGARLFPEVVDKIGKSVGELLTSYPKVFEAFLHDTPISNQEIQLTIDKTQRFFSLSLMPITNKKKARVGRIMSLTDITQLKHLTSTDPLTQVLNRAELLRIIGIELKRAQQSRKPVSLIVFNLDRFKKINERYGHNNGDEVLKSFATTVSSELGKDNIFGRYGGEEFIALLRDTTKHSARQGAEEIRELIAELPVETNGVSIPYTVSIGVASCEEEAAAKEYSIVSLLHFADKALYRAKEDGRNQVAVWEEKAFKKEAVTSEATEA